MKYFVISYWCHQFTILKLNIFYRIHWSFWVFWCSFFNDVIKSSDTLGSVSPEKDFLGPKASFVSLNYLTLHSILSKITVIIIKFPYLSSTFIDNAHLFTTYLQVVIYRHFINNNSIQFHLSPYCFLVWLSVKNKVKWMFDSISIFPNLDESLNSIIFRLKGHSACKCVWKITVKLFKCYHYYWNCYYFERDF